MSCDVVVCSQVGFDRNQRVLLPIQIYFQLTKVVMFEVIWVFTVASVESIFIYATNYNTSR